MIRSRPACQRGRVDDAIAVELVADDHGLIGHQRRQDAHDRRVGRAEQHGAGAAVECGQALLQGEVRLRSAADEADRAGGRHSLVPPPPPQRRPARGRTFRGSCSSSCAGTAARLRPRAGSGALDRRERDNACYDALALFSRPARSNSTSLAASAASSFRVGIVAPNRRIRPPSGISAFCRRSSMSSSSRRG